jgi:hypothetical protein
MPASLSSRVLPAATVLSRRTATLTALLVVAAAAPSAAQRTTAHKAKVVNVAVERRSGDRVRGPRSIVLTGVNTLRYDVRVGVTVTFGAGPDLRVPFIPPIPDPGGGEQSEEVMVQARKRESTALGRILDELRTLETRRATKVQAVIAGLLRLSNEARLSVEALVSSSDGVLSTPDGAATLAGAAKVTAGVIGGAIATTWPEVEIQRQHGDVRRLQGDLAGIEPASDDKTLYDYLDRRLNTLDTWYEGIAAQGETGRAAAEAQGRLRAWKTILDAIGASGEKAFEIGPVDEDCSFSFGGSKESKFELIKRDRLAAPGTAETREEIATVVCSSPFSVSGGFGASALDNETFAFVSSTRTGVTDGTAATASVSRFGRSENSSYQLLPLLLVNTRVWEPNDVVSVLVSAGAAVDPGSGESGTDIEYVVGPSIAFKRDFIVTLGCHFGRSPVLAGGFALDDEVPEGLAAPPLEQRRDKAFMLAVTFKIR